MQAIFHKVDIRGYSSLVALTFNGLKEYSSQKIIEIKNYKIPIHISLHIMLFEKMLYYFGVIIYTHEDS